MRTFIFEHRTSGQLYPIKANSLPEAWDKLANAGANVNEYLLQGAQG